MGLQWPLYTQPDLYMCTLPLHTRDQVQVSIGDWEELCGGGDITTKQGIETGGDDMSIYPSAVEVKKGQK